MADNRDNIQDVVSIEQSKTLNPNSYLGTVEIKCLINGYCPFTGELIESTMVLDSNSLASLPDSQRQQFSYVNGLPGIYLREIYRYRSNWLIWGKKDGGSDQTTGNQIAATPEEALEPEVAAATVGSDGSSPNYKKQQTWQVVPSPIDGLRVPPPSQVNCPTCSSSIANDSKARFSYIRPSRSIEGNEKEANDSTVLAIQQMSAGQAGQPGVHWKVEKIEPLFEGEDFFIEFIGTVLQQDLSKTESKLFVDKTYGCIDVNVNGSGTSVGSGAIGTAPKNFGVVTYNISPAIAVPSSATLRGMNLTPAMLQSLQSAVAQGATYQKDSASMQRFDFHRQSYVIVELLAAMADIHFLILMPENFKPTFIKVVKGVSYNLGVYEGTTCKELFSKPSFRMTVRNHLGDIVITFNGYEDNPWIVRNDFNGLDNDGIFRIPDECKLSIWGGNSKIAFSFSPLQYGKVASLSVPPPSRGADDRSDTPTVSPSPFVLPKEHVKNYIFLSSSDVMPKGVDDSDNPEQALDYADFLNKRHPYYTCDASEINEDGTVSGIKGTQPSYFTYTKAYIKAADKDTNNPKLSLTKKEVSSSTSTTTASAGGATATVGSEDSGKFTYIIANLELTSGDHKFSSDPSGSSASTTFTLENCKTPVATHVRAISVPDGTDLWKTDEKDVSEHVIHFKDSWSSTDYNTCEHSGDISFLLDPSGEDVGKLTQTKYLEGLKDKMFYIEVWARYTKCSYSLGDDNQFYKLFTGMCAGGTIKQQPVERIMECKIIDYMTVLKDKFFWNSPFFDAVRDINAAYEVLSMGSFKADPPGGGNNDPAGAYPPLKYLKESVLTNGRSTPGQADGRPYTCDEYVLPFSWSRLQSPTFKYPDGTKLYDSLADWAKRASKMFFFDQHGIFHWENSTGIAMSKQKNADMTPMWLFASGDPGDGGENTDQLVFNAMTKEGSVTDIYNDIHMITSTPNMELISKGQINWKSIENPDSPGFIGYRKVMLQQESFFGNENAITNAIEYYKAFWKAL